MSAIEELIRVENDGTLSFGNYLLKSKMKVLDFEVNGDLYYVKTFEELTRLEKNNKLLLEAVPGASVHNLKMDEKIVKFSIEAKDDIKITMELEADKDYKIFVDDFNVGNVKANVSGKVYFSVDATSGVKEVKIEKIN